MSYQISLPTSIDATATSGGAVPAPVDDPALRHALGMAGLGYVPIAVAAQGLVGVPLKAGSKDYRLKDPVGKWSDAVADEADVRKRFGYAIRVGGQHAAGDGPAIAVGLRTDGICVVDLDTAKSPEVKQADPKLAPQAHHKAALRMLDELLTACGETDEAKRKQLVAWMVRLPYVRTPSGGRHAYFQTPEGVDVKSDTNVLGVRFVDIRGSGGYAMSPGAVLADGRVYQPLQLWTRASDGKLVATKLGEWPSRDQLPLLPEPLLSKLPRAKARALVAGTPAIAGASRRGRGTTYAGAPMQDFLPLDAKALVEALAWWPSEDYSEWRTVRTALIRRADDERLERPCCNKLAFEIFRAWAATTTNNSFSEAAAVAEWDKGLERLYDASGNEVKGIEAGTLVERMTQARASRDGKAKHAAGRRRGRIEVELYNSAVRLAATDLDLAWQIGDVIEHWRGSSAVPPLPPRPGTAALASADTAATVGSTSTAVAVAPIKVPLPRSGDPGLIAVRWHERDDDGKIPPTRQNITAALAHWRVALKLNTFSGDVDAFGCADFDVLDDDGLNQLHQSVVEAGMVINDRKFRDALSSIVWERRYNPVTEYVDSLAWDGKPRIDTALTTYFRAADTPLTRGFSKAFFIAAVRRARRPGTKHDCMLVFESGQGAGKSSGLAALVPDARWFTDSVELGADPKLMIERTRGSWIVEVAEMSGRRDQVERVKTQLSATTDKARLAFGRLAKQVPRAFVMTGSINPNASQQYLLDETGGRRFWPVECLGEVDVAGIIRDRDQLWAEAAHREARGEPHVLDRGLWAAAAAEQEKRRVKGGIEEALIDAFGHITGGAILSTDVLGIVGLGNGHSGGPKPPTQTESAQVAAAMARMGWEQRRRQSPLRPPNETPRIWIKGSGAPWLWVAPGTTEVKPAATVNQAGGRPVP